MTSQSYDPADALLASLLSEGHRLAHRETKAEAKSKLAEQQARMEERRAAAYEAKMSLLQWRAQYHISYVTEARCSNCGEMHTSFGSFATFMTRRLDDSCRTLTQSAPAPYDGLPRYSRITRVDTPACLTCLPNMNYILELPNATT